MNLSNNSTMIKHTRGKHLSYEERILIQIRRKDNRSMRSIARELGCSPQTISNEIKRGTTNLYHGSVKRYKAEVGQKAYQNHRLNSGRKLKYLTHKPFIDYVKKHFFKHNWSLDACWGRATATGQFTSRDVVCTKTLYNYVDKGLIDIKNADLPEKLKRNTKRKKVRLNKKKLGRSIDERPKEIDNRTRFGDWECDLVLGHKTKDDEVLLTLCERMSREFLIIRIPDKTSASVMQAFQSLHNQYSEHWNDIFKTITTDNGSEFADLSTLEEVSKTLVYYAHPYTSCDKGSVEKHNGLIRRFIPKGDRIDNYSLQEVIDIETWMNTMPRKQLAYHTPDEIFERELDNIYQVA
ncbi:MAG: IS30 family transposase [Lactobacillus sp.]